MENSSKIPTERIDVLDAKLTTIDNSILSIQQSILDLNTRLEEVNTNLTTLINNNYTDLNTKITALQTRATNLEARRYVIENWRSGSSWYRLYSDKWIEQGGICNATQYNNTAVNVNFFKKMKDTTYFAMACANTPDHQGTWSINARCAVKTTTGMSVHGANNVNSAYTGACSWMIKGFIA